MRPSTSTPSSSTTAPAKVRPGYANFAIADPPLKLVLIEQPCPSAAASAGRSITWASRWRHTDEVAAASGRLAGEGLDAPRSTETTCCYAVQDKVWVEDPDGAPWEVYTVLGRRRAGSSGRDGRWRLL